MNTDFKEINHAKQKKDSISLLTGKPVYTADLAPSNCLIIKILRSPHANAMITDIDTSSALKIPGVECILTYKDVPEHRYTVAGQAYQELSPYDRLILDRHLRYVGDPVAIVAAVDEKSALQALNLIKVKYEVLQPLLDFRTAKDNSIIVHPEDNWRLLVDNNSNVKRNIISENSEKYGNDLDTVLADCDVTIDETFYTKQAQQVMSETFRTFAVIDSYGRITVTSSTQIPFHARRIIAYALGVPKSQVRVIKPRIGGGFGAKQTIVSEIYPALVTKITGKPSIYIMTRKETFDSAGPRHEGDIRVRIGAMKDGKIRALALDVLWNAGAYGEHSTTTLELTGRKTLPLYNRTEASVFNYTIVYTNTQPGGAYRGFGVPQSTFAVESAMNMLAHKLNIDVMKLHEMNIVKEGEIMPAHYGDPCTSCSLDRCLQKVKELGNWDKEPLVRKLPNGKLRAKGLAIAMQGSSISNVDTAAVTIKLNDDGFYAMGIGAADMGTGCDTVLAQIAAERLMCSTDNIVVHGVDTDISPYDTGSYASSTTYLTGRATIKACDALLQKMIAVAAEKLCCDAESAEFDGTTISWPDKGKQMTLTELAYAVECGGNTALMATEASVSPLAPPPYTACVAEVEIDPDTGKTKVVKYNIAADCGTVINTALARVQLEGAAVQGIGMALTEDVCFSKEGRLQTNSLMQYKVPARSEIGEIQVAFEESYEPNGPFGAKSIGEVAINSAAPAIANAICNATGFMSHTLPIRSEDVWRALHK